MKVILHQKALRTRSLMDRTLAKSALYLKLLVESRIKLF